MTGPPFLLIVAGPLHSVNLAHDPSACNKLLIVKFPVKLIAAPAIKFNES